MENKKRDQLIIDIVAFFKKWCLWEPVQIFCDGMCYSSFRIDNSIEGTGDLSGVYIAPVSFDGESKYIDFYREPPQSEPLMTLIFEGVGFSELLSYGFYKATSWEISEDALLFITREEGLLYECEEELRARPLLDDTEFDSYEDFLELEAELEEQELLQRLREIGPILCSRSTTEAIAKELDNIFSRYGVEYYPLGYEIWGYVCFEENATADT